MDHSEAAENKIAEGYVLGELLPEERDAFEEHFFQCAECAEDVRDAATVLDSLQVVLQQPKVIAFPSRWANVWATAATIATLTFGSLFMYQRAIVIPRLADGGPAQAVQMELGETRSGIEQSGQPSVPVVKADQRFVLILSIPVVDAQAFRAEIRKNGSVIRSHPITAAEAKNFVYLPEPSLGAGDYELVIQSVPDQGQPIASRPLEVR
jgi:anti-sigma factor RsiW